MAANREFVVKIKDQDVSLMVRKPRLDELREAQKIHTRTFHDALNAGAILRAKLDDVLKEQGLWGDDKDIEIKTLQKEIAELEVKLRGGGLRLDVAKNIALDIIDKRNKIKEIVAIKLVYDSKTAESQADDARTDYLVSVCLVYNDKDHKPYFKNLEDYLNSQNDTVAIEGYRNFLMLLNDSTDDYEKDFIEYKFLKRFNFVDDKLRLVNKEGHLVDREGRLIDENNRYIRYDSNGNKEYIDINNNVVDENGDYKIDEKPFLDDEGNEIV